MITINNMKRSVIQKLNDMEEEHTNILLLSNIQYIVYVRHCKLVLHFRKKKRKTDILKYYFLNINS